MSYIFSLYPTGMTDEVNSEIQYLEARSHMTRQRIRVFKQVRQSCRCICELTLKSIFYWFHVKWHQTFGIVNTICDLQ